MEFELSLAGFRGFASAASVPIRPITLLIGENNSGKTSVLAAIKFVYDFLSGREEPSFNNPPFQLGTFEQIAHHRGGRAGRAKEVRITARKIVSPKNEDGAPTLKPLKVELLVALRGSESSTEISRVEFRAARRSIRLSRTGESTQWEVSTNLQNYIDVTPGFPIPMRLSLDEARLLRLFMRDFLMFRRGPSRTDLSESQVEEVNDAIGALSRYIQPFFSDFDTHIEATSAIRTKPLRTYTPGTDLQDSEGSHVPFDIAKLARRRNKEEWLKLSEQLNKFGRESDMFHEIDVKSFGQTASDPFQIVFSSLGPRRNIVDLGYGTSQVLPIIYTSAKGSAYGSTFLIQQPEVHLHPKAQAALAQFFVDAFKAKSQNFILETHSDFIVDRIRAEIARGSIAKGDVSLLFLQRRRLENSITEVKLNDHGEPVDPPRGYRTFFLDEQLRTLGI